MKAKELFPIMRAAFKEWNDEDPFRQSAVVAYYSVFSLPALLVIIIAIVGLAYNPDQIREMISSQLGSMMGPETASAINEMVTKASDIENSTWALIIGIITLVVGATGVFAQLQKILNIIFDVQAKPNKGLLKSLKDRFFSFGLIISIAFLLLISLVLTSLLTMVGDYVGGYIPDWAQVIFQVINFIFSFAVTSVLFALMFKILPDVKLSWRSVFPGAIFTAFLFELGKFGLSFYFGEADPGADYGAAASIVLILLWVSYSCMILFYGAEFVKQYVIRNEGKILPARDAMKIPAICGQFM